MCNNSRYITGMKKLLWPVMIGLQVVKTVLIMMFLPSIIGSLGKIVGKGKNACYVGPAGMP